MSEAVKDEILEEAPDGAIGPLCGDCHFFEDKGKFGVCHRHPPSGTTGKFSVWPNVAHTEWCGEWTPRLKKEKGDE